LLGTRRINSHELGDRETSVIAKRLERFFDDEIIRLKLPWIAQWFSVGLRSQYKSAIALLNIKIVNL
jgi:hypothetical protein